jgi:hypothetical protein
MSSTSSRGDNVPAADHGGASATREDAHRAIVAAAACWLGGVWTDAKSVDEPSPGLTAQHRCQDLVRRIWGQYDKGTYERLRALDPGEVSQLVDRIAAVASSQGIAVDREQRMSKLLQAIADAERETMSARRAGDRVKKDLDGERPAAKLTGDEIAAVAPLRETKALEALLAQNVGDLSHEARAFAILNEMDRMETARGLPKQLKVYVVQKPYAVAFGVTAAPVPDDATKPLKGGTWLGYLTTVAAAAGHPVPKSAKSLRDRELLAWGGAMMGFADELRTEAAQISSATDLKGVADAIVRRLEIQYRASESAVRFAPEPAEHGRTS